MEPRTVAALALATRRCTNLAKSHPQLGLISSTKLALRSLLLSTDRVKIFEQEKDENIGK